MKGSLVIIGAGGHAKVVIGTLQEIGHSISAVYDDNANKWGDEILGVPITGPTAASENEPFTTGIIAIGDNSTRKKIARSLKLQWLTIVHPTAYVHRSVKLGSGTVVFAGAIIQPETVVGDHVIVNTGASVDHDCMVGDFVHLAPGVHLSGEVQVDEGAFLGIGSSVIPGIKIGSWTTLGAGGVAVRDLPSNKVALGVPAKLKS